ncbi:helix-turn-helix domain-containing protein [Longispora fulva]|uniref:helix-turn-helix domain-containing protein n=1 Tax=Longispora fulva TaxID=619741 RepID=UPI002279D32C|nr:helix-turn-helix domain-containing protein [Longispora fulva]
MWGAKLREWRSQMGWSQVALGKAVPCDSSHIGYAERGERGVSRALAVKLDSALKAGGALLGLWDTLFGGTPHEASSAADEASLVGPVVNERNSDARLAPGLQLVLPVRTAKGQVVYVDAQVNALGQFADVDSPAIDHHPIEYYDESRRLLAECDNRFGARNMLPAALEQFKLVQQAKLYHSDRRGDWLRLLAEYADLVGWLHQDVGDHQAAEFWIDKSLGWATTAGDWSSMAFVMARMSQLAGEMGRGDEAVETAEAAIRMARPRSKIAAIAATYAGHGHALLGDSDEAERSFDLAHELLSDAEPEAVNWGQYFDEPYIQVCRAQSRTVLGRYEAAMDAYDLALPSLQEGFRRDQGVYLAREARACAGQEDAARAASLGLRALSIQRDTRSARAKLELVELTHALVVWRGDPDVQQFIDAMSAQPGGES